MHNGRGWSEYADDCLEPGFGGGAAKPADFLNGFRPNDEKPNKSTDDALAAIKMTVDQFEAAFVRWLQTAR
jgi:hypothetical protein